MHPGVFVILFFLFIIVCVIGAIVIYRLEKKPGGAKTTEYMFQRQFFLNMFKEGDTLRGKAAWDYDKGEIWPQDTGEVVLPVQGDPERGKCFRKTFWGRSHPFEVDQSDHVKFIKENEVFHIFGGHKFFSDEQFNIIQSQAEEIERLSNENSKHLERINALEEDIEDQKKQERKAIEEHSQGMNRFLPGSKMRGMH